MKKEKKGKGKEMTDKIEPTALAKKYMYKENEEKPASVQNKVFAETTSDDIATRDDINIYFVTCYHCAEIFGILHSFIDKTSEIQFVYTCPYCSAKGGI